MEESILGENRQDAKQREWSAGFSRHMKKQTAARFKIAGFSLRLHYSERSGYTFIQAGKAKVGDLRCRLKPALHLQATIHLAFEVFFAHADGFGSDFDKLIWIDELQRFFQ